MIDLTEEYREAAARFKQHFGYGVPLFMIPQTAQTDDVIANILSCIENDQDDLLARYGVEEDDSDILY